MAIYHEGHKNGEVLGGSVLAKLKEEYKSHRRPSPLDSMMKTTPRKPWAIKKMLVPGGVLRQPVSAPQATADAVAALLAEGAEEDDRLEVSYVEEIDEDYEEELAEHDEGRFDLEYQDE